jgi:hypothetical protein
MSRTIVTCAVTATVCFAVGAGTGLALPRGGQETVRGGEAGYFPIVSLYCLPEHASGAPRFHEPDVACDTASHEYTGRGVWFSKSRIVITSPPIGASSIPFGANPSSIAQGTFLITGPGLSPRA